MILAARGALAQPAETSSPSPVPSASPLPAPSPSALPSPSPSPSLPPAGIVPAGVVLDVTGAPADGVFLDAQIRNALDRKIRPTLRPGASIAYGPIAPWPLPSLPAGSRAAANVTVTITGDDTAATVSGVTNVTFNSVVAPEIAPTVLFFSDDPEYLLTDGLVFRGEVDVKRPARLYYYHDNIGLPRDLDVVLTAAVPTRVHVTQTRGGPDLDVMSVGHTVSRDFLAFTHQGEGAILELAPRQPLILRHDLIFQGELVAGAIDLAVLSGGPLAVSVVASPAGGSPERYLTGPRLSLDGHNRHGTFDLGGYGDFAATYTAGGPDVSVTYGAAGHSPRNLDPADPGRDYGDYGVVNRIAFRLVNPTDVPQPVYLYEKPHGGPVRSTFLVDGQLKELGCARLPQPYWLMTYQLPAHSVGLSTTLTMTDGGSYYPLEFGVTKAPPVPYTPPLGSLDGCSPVPLPSPSPSATPPEAVPSDTP